MARQKTTKRKPPSSNKEKAALVNAFSSNIRAKEAARRAACRGEKKEKQKKLEEEALAAKRKLNQLKEKAKRRQQLRKEEKQEKKIEETARAEESQAAKRKLKQLTHRAKRRQERRRQEKEDKMMQEEARAMFLPRVWRKDFLEAMERRREQDTKRQGRRRSRQTRQQKAHDRVANAARQRFAREKTRQANQAQRSEEVSGGVHNCWTLTRDQVETILAEKDAEGSLDTYFADMCSNPSKAVLLYYLNSGYCRFDLVREFDGLSAGETVNIEKLRNEICDECLTENELQGLMTNFHKSHSFVDDHLWGCATCGLREMEQREGCPTRKKHRRVELAAMSDAEVDSAQRGAGGKISRIGVHGKASHSNRCVRAHVGS